MVNLLYDFKSQYYMFIRSKTISGRKYAYLVRTKWDKRSKKVKQKVSKYLGPIVQLEQISDLSFFDYYDYDFETYINTVKIDDLVFDLVELELVKHGFTKKSKNVLVNGPIEVDIKKMDKVFSMNEGFMHRFTLKEIGRYDKILDAKKRIPYKFAALFVNAGIDIEKELFVELYQRFFSNNIEESEMED